MAAAAERVEEQFYLFWPLVLALVGRVRSRHAVLVLFACGALVRYSLIRSGAPEEALWAGTFANLDPLLIGAALALFGGKGSTAALIDSGGRRWVALSLGTAILICCGNLQFWQGAGANIVYPAAALGCGLLLIGVRSSGFGQSGAVGRALGSLGRISYGFYVFHVLSINLASRILDNPWFSVPVGALICWAAAMSSFHALERPFLALRSRWSFIASGAPA